MNMADLVTFEVGQYTIRRRQEPGHQCPLYCVFLKYVLIGKCISVPDVDACKWLERQQREQTFYAYSIAPLTELSKNKNGVRRSVGNARRAAEARAARTRRIAGV